jgi:hypothetical protein
MRDWVRLGDRQGAELQFRLTFKMARIRGATVGHGRPWRPRCPAKVPQTNRIVRMAVKTLVSINTAMIATQESTFATFALK